jgi:PqqD family protein of HPr-rel-A system
MIARPLVTCDVGRYALTEKREREQCWRIIQGLKWRCWDSDYVVFNPLSGHTHFPDILTGQILALLMAGSCTASAVRLSVSRFLEVPDDHKLAATVDDILRRLEDAGLVERSD